MSGIILLSFHRHVNSERIRLEEQVEQVKQYWNSPEMQEQRLRAEQEQAQRKMEQEERERVQAQPENLLLSFAQKGDAAKGASVRGQRCRCKFSEG